MIEELKTDNFARVIKGDKPVLVDFWASWCGPCRMLAPAIDGLADEYSGKVQFGKVNVDEQGDLAAEYAVASIPTVIIFKDGKPAGKLIGVHDADEYRDELDKIL